ncbi:MAG TPA: SCE4755 family polysaccharide monooxygenase-like protein [Polyangiaceae bacterium]|nr:SCE4755 family polysaccharide monooxygenase-like protein [Polyangiaceae bacterium]
MRSSVLVLAVSLLALPATAQAHFTLIMPPPASNSTNGGKGDPPCGPTDMPSNVVTPVMGGSKLTLQVNETVFHPGFYRVALSIKSRSELPPDNVVKDSKGMVLAPDSTGTSATADYQTNPVFPVLADNLWPHTTSTKSFSGEITLPNVNCDKCTLQVIEFMAQHGSNGPKAGFFYHHCADLKITADTSKPIFDPAAGSAGGGSSGGASSTGGAGGTGAASGGAAGAIAAGGNATGGTAPSSGGSAPIGTSGGGTGGSATAGGAPASVGSSAGASNANSGGAPPVHNLEREPGGCAINQHAAGERPLLALLLGLLVLGRRRNRRC